MGKAKGLKEGVYPFVPLEFERLAVEEQRRRAAEFEARLKSRRSK